MEGVLIEDRQQDTILYAATAKVNITDWFFFKDKVELEYIGLDNAIIKLQRSDSVWRYKFIVDYFGGGNKEKKKSNLELSLSKVEMNNVRVLMKDGWRGKDETISFSHLDVDAHQLKFTGNKYEVEKIKIIDPVYAAFDYKGNRPESLRPKKVNKNNGLPWNNENLELVVKQFIIQNGTVRSDKDDGRLPYDHFDGHHVLFTNISGEINNVKIYHDTLFAKLNLTTKERSGFEVNELSADLKMHPKGMVFNNLTIITPRSKLKNYYAMSYENFNDDMNDYISSVIMDGNFTGSEISSDDIAFFAPELKTWKKKISITGKMKGTVENFSAKNFVLEAGNGTRLNGDISINGLPDIDKTYIDFKANDLTTSYNDLATFFPDVKEVISPNIRALQNINFKGTLTGFVRDFVSAGVLQTSIGTVKTDLNLKLPKGKASLYSGSISTNNFNLGLFLNDPQLGIVSTDVKIKGEGLGASNMNATLDATVREMQFNHYTYKNFAANGKLIKTSFSGHISSKDENAMLELDGTINYDKKNPSFNFISDIGVANLKPLGFAKENISLRGKLEGNFSGLSLDKFLGTANASDFTITRDDNSYHFDSVQLSSSIADGIKVLRLDSRDVQAEVTGKFNISELSNDVQYLLHNYYPAYIPLPKAKPTNDNFTFKLQTVNTEELTPIIDPFIKGLSNTHIEGSVNLATNQLSLTGDIPYFSYKEYEFISTKIITKGDRDSLTLTATSKNYIYADSLNFPDVSVFVNASDDTSRFRIVTLDNPTFQSVDLNTYLYTFNNGFKIKLLPGYFHLFDKKWTMEKDGTLEYRSDLGLVTADNIKFTQGEKFVEINSEPSSEERHNDLVLNFKKINIGEILPVFVKEPKIEGLSTGKVRIIDPFGHPKIQSEGVYTEKTRVNDDSIGLVTTDVYYDIDKGIINYTAKSVNPPDHNFDVTGTINLKDSTDKQFVAEVNIDNSKLSAIRRYLSSIMSDVNGDVSGKLKIYGRTDDLKYSGKGHLRNASFIVDYTKCKYLIEDADLSFVEDGIDFGTLVLKDTLGNTASLAGKLFHNNFRDFAFRFNLSTNRLLLLNTNASNNNQFYGNVIGRANLRITGPQSDMRMVLTGGVVDSSSIYIPTGNTRESGLGKDIVFKQYGREMKPQLGSQETDITVDLDLSVNEYAKMYVIIGDVIEAKGHGNLKIRAGTSEDLKIRGKYEITSGKYTYNLQNLIQKPFTFPPESGSYIEWNGDPYDANLYIRAKYTAQKVRFSDLLSGTNISLTDNRLTNYLGDVDIYANIRGNLAKPEIDFEIEFPENSEISRDKVVESLFNQMKNDKNELTKQVSTLLVFNQFTALSQDINVNTSAWNVGFNSISNLVLNEISMQLNKAVAKAFKSNDWDINIGNSFYNSFYNSQGVIPNRSQLNLKIVRRFLNNRLSITFEGDLDIRVVKNSGEIDNSLQGRGTVFLPNITADYKLSKEGKLSLTLFYRNNFDFISPDKRNRAGVGLSYKEESDVYSRMRKKKRKEQTKG